MLRFDNFCTTSARSKGLNQLEDTLRLKTILTTLFATLMLVVGLDYVAVAATGKGFVLGRSNSAGTQTTLTRTTAGTTLQLNSKAGSAPLKVNRPVKATNLNADLLDGKDQSRFALASGNVKAYDLRGKRFDLDGNGFTDAIIASGTCPTGTRRTGGGGADFTATGVMVMNAPDSGRSWTVAVLVDENVAEDPSDVTASVVCYSPRGVPAGGYARMAAGAAADSPSAKLLAKLARAAGNRN